MENHARYSIFISLACRRSQEVQNNNQLSIVIPILEIAHHMSPENNGYPKECVVLDIAILALIWRNSSSCFFLVAEFHMEPQTWYLGDH